MKELAALAYRDTTQENRDYWKNEMAGALREIQACYDEKLDVMKGELDTFYNLKVSCCVAKTLGVVRLWPLGSPKLCRNHQMAPIIKSTDMPGAATTPKIFQKSLSVLTLKRSIGLMRALVKGQGQIMGFPYCVITACTLRV